MNSYRFIIGYFLALLFALAFRVPAASADDSYRWLDQNGRIFFGSNPPKDALEVTKLPNKALSRYSSDRVLKRLGGPAKPAKTPIPEMSPKKPIRALQSAQLEQGELRVDMNEAGQVISCAVAVRNTGASEAKEVSIAFDFPDGTLIPGVGPETIAGNSAADYAVPKELLPLSLKGAAQEGKDTSPPSPRVIIHGAIEKH